MANILLLETSATICSVALSGNGSLLWNQQCTEGRQHAQKLGVFVDEVMTFASTHELSIDALAVSCGPGSYTGLRIGVSLAKGLCYGLNIPLMAIPTTKILIAGLEKKLAIEEHALLCPMIDARRMEVYTCLEKRNGESLLPISAQIIADNYLEHYLSKHQIYFFGDGASKCEPVITHHNAMFVHNIEPIAENMLTLAEQYYCEHRFEDVAYFEPFYLKDFLLTESKKKFF